jgi:selenocysteine-specific elongation factor
LRSSVFEARARISSPDDPGLHSVCVRISDKTFPAAVTKLGPVSVENKNDFLIRVEATREMDVHWGERFSLTREEKGEDIGEGMILNPLCEAKGKKTPKDIDFLKQLTQGEEEMILALARKNGIHGIAGGEIEQFSSLEKSLTVNFCLKLEEMGKVRILSFSPLFLFYKPSFEFLTEKLVGYLRRNHQEHPKEIGVSRQAIRKRFSLHPRLLSLVLKSLVEQGRIRVSDAYVSLSSHKVFFSPKEEQVLQELEKICLKGEIRSLTLKDLQKKFDVSPKKLDMMIAHLADKIKVVQAKEGFIVHSEWLESLIRDLKESVEKTLTISEFKARTGLSRKYAIPLLELLDQMGVTRRKGTSREIM